MVLHYFKAYSRLGMINIPHGGTKLNLGVEYGPDAVLSKSFVKRTKNSTVSSFTFPLPEKIDRKKYASIIATSSKKFSTFINAELKPGETQIVVGGDHSVAFGSFLAVLQRVKSQRIGYIQFDSHGDINLFKTSPTANFHGMWFRPFFGDFDHTEIQRLVTKKVKPSHVLFIGDLELDPEEVRLFSAYTVANITGKNIDQHPKSAAEKVKKFVSGFDHIHVSFDIDVFAKKFVRATGTPSIAGLAPKDVLPLLRLIRQAKSLSMDLVEVNPKKPGAKETIQIAQDVLMHLFIKP